MKDMRVKELLGIAAQEFTVTDDPDAVDAIMRRADRLRRRRRIAYAACSAVAVVAVGVGTALLPQPGLGVPHTRTHNRVAATEPAVPPVVPSAPAPEPTSGGGVPSASAVAPPTAPAAEPTTSAPSPQPGPTTSAPPARTTPEATTSSTRRATSSPTTPTSTSASPSPPTVASAADSPPVRTAAEIIAGYLPPDAGTVTRQTRAAATQSHPLAGTYLVKQNGRTGVIQVSVRDPDVNPGEAHRSVKEELAYDHCAPDRHTPANTDCTTDTRPDGSVLKTWTRPGNQRDATSSLVFGKGYAASVTYPDGRAVVVTALAGITGSAAYGTPMDAPPLGRSAVAAAAGDPAWFAS